MLLYTRVIHGWFPVFMASSFLASEVADALRAALPQLFRESLQSHQPPCIQCHLALCWCRSFLSSEVCLSAWPLGWGSLALSLAFVPGCCVSERPLMATGSVSPHLQALHRRHVPKQDQHLGLPVIWEELRYLAIILLGEL